MIIQLFLLALISLNIADSKSKPVAVVQNIRLSQQFLHPPSLRSQETCFGNSLTELKSGQELNVTATKPFSLFFTTEFTDNYLNMQQYYRENLGDITVNALLLSKKEANNDSLHIASLPLTMKCSYDMHPYFRLKASLSIHFYADNFHQKYEFNLLLVCAQAAQVKHFSNFYISGYILFWMMFNLVLQVYHNYPRDGEHYVCFIIFMVISLVVRNDLLAYFLGGGGMLLLIFRERKVHAINSKMFSLYMFFGIVVALQAFLTFQGTRQHQLWNSFWIALDNFIVIHIAMLMVLRLVKLSRIRHVFWYFIAVSIFSVLYEGNNRYFQLQFKNPLNLTCIKISVFFPIMMLPISNYFTTMTTWMHRVIAMAILVASVIPLPMAMAFMGVVFMGVLLFQVSQKDSTVIRHRC